MDDKLSIGMILSIFSNYSQGQTELLFNGFSFVYKRLVLKKFSFLKNAKKLLFIYISKKG